MNDLVVTPHPLTLEGRRVICGAELLPGDTLLTFVGRQGVDLALEGWCVSIGGAHVPPAMWARTRPQHGHVVEVRRVAGKQAVAFVAIAALAYFTMGTGLAAVGGLGGYLGLAGGAAFALNVGVMALGGLVINRLLGPPRLKAPTYDASVTGTTYSLQGGRNRARQYEPLGLLFGTVRVVPDLAAQPFAWFEGDEQFQYLRLHGGINCGAIDALRVGDTLLSAYQDVTVATSGLPGSAGWLMNWSSVDTVAGAVLDAPASPGAWTTRTSSVNTTRLAVDLTAQLYAIDDKGKASTASVTLGIEKRLLPSGAFGPFDGSSTVTISSSATKPRRLTLSVDVAEGQYEVRLRKVTANASTTRSDNAVEWLALKSYQRNSTDYGGLPQVGIRVKASGQVNGVLDQVNWMATSAACPVWDGGAWSTVATNNPGAHILLFARGIWAGGRLVAGMGKPDSQIDIEGLKSFMVHCAAKGYTFDHWFDAPANCGEVLEAFAAAGLGSISYHTGKLGVVWADADQPREAVLSPVRMKPGTFRVDYATRELADEIEVSWPESANNWLPASVRVKAPGVAMPRETARMAPVGVVTQAAGVRAARWAMAQNIWQRKAVIWEMDLEHIAFRRFSMIALSHDLTRWGYSGRLRAATRNLLLYSEDLRNSAEAGSARPWGQYDDAGNAVAVSIVAGVGPWGGVASKLQAGTVGVAQRQVYQVFAAPDGARVTASVFAKAGECTFLSMVVATKDASPLYPSALFNLAAGAVAGTYAHGGASLTAAMEPVGSGWYRCSVTLDVRSGPQVPSLNLLLRTAANGNFAPAAVGDGLLLGGAQAVLGSEPGVYVRTTNEQAVCLTLDGEVPWNSAAAQRFVALHIPGEAGYRVFGVQAFAGSTHQLTLASAWPAGVAVPGDSAGNPAHDTVWMYDFAAQPGKRLRVVSIEPTANLSGARVTAVPEPDEFWSFMATGAYEAPPAAALAAPVVASSLRVTQQRADVHYDNSTELCVTFDASGPYDHAQVWGARDGDPLVLLGETRTTTFVGWRVGNDGMFRVQVRPFDALGRAGNVLAGTCVVALGYLTAAGSGGNRVPNPVFWDSSLQGWTWAAYLLAGSMEGADFWGGQYSLTGRGQGYMRIPGAFVADGAYLDGRVGGFKVTPGRYYQFSLLVCLHRGGVQIFSANTDAAGTVLSYSGFPGGAYSSLPANGANPATWKVGSGNMGPGNVEANYARLFFTVQAPPGCAVIYPYVRLFQSSPGGDNNYAFLSQVMFCEVGAATSAAVPFDMGSGFAQLSAEAAFMTAEAAQATADGKIDSFYSPSPPIAASEGDLWFDTDDGRRQYRYTSGAWVLAGDTRIGDAIDAAADAQATADGKIETFVSPSPPVAAGLGDMWFDSDDGHKQYRYNGATWVPVPAGTSQFEPNAASELTFDSTDSAGVSVTRSGLVGIYTPRWHRLAGASWYNWTTRTVEVDVTVEMTGTVTTNTGSGSAHLRGIAGLVEPDGSVVSELGGAVSITSQPGRLTTVEVVVVAPGNAVYAGAYTAVNPSSGSTIEVTGTRLRTRLVARKV